MDKVQEEIKRLEKDSQSMARINAFVDASVKMFKECDFTFGEGLSSAVSLMLSCMASVNGNKYRKEEMRSDMDTFLDKYLN